MLTRFDVKIPSRWNGLVLYQVLAQCLPIADLTLWQKRWWDKLVLVDDLIMPLEEPVFQGQKLTYWVENYQEPSVPTNWQLIWEDDELLVVDKPALLPVSRTTRNPTQHLIGLVQQSGFADAHLIHRIDIETSGLIVLAKTKQAAQYWQPRLKELLVEKVYHARVWGNPVWDSQHVECQLSTVKDSDIRCQMHVVTSAGQKSISDFKVLNRYGDQSIVECKLTTGRKHQIRAQLNWLGHPIVGDKIYSFHGKFYLKRLDNGLSVADLTILGANHQQLLAYQITLVKNNSIFTIHSSTKLQG
ncbi:RluA family pseudouridine synthase [Celerinatantimonas sp. MCCC 1A17872]|uniref:RluA family pseudouridine synthase n=1 Tax=Celerinatantimonas sp. MCCC 1A17872 TaxID=3177514 RepID=UPI0038C10C6D